MTWSEFFIGLICGVISVALLLLCITFADQRRCNELPKNTDAYAYYCTGGK